MNQKTAIVKTAIITAMISIFLTSVIIKLTDDGEKKVQISERTKVVHLTEDKENDYFFADTPVTEADPYNGFPAPVELKLTGTNGSVNIDNENINIEVEGVYMIEDTDGYNYLVVNYTATNTSSEKQSTSMGTPELLQNEKGMDQFYYITDECKNAYDEIIQDDSWYYGLDLRPGETKNMTRFFEVYDTSSAVTVGLFSYYSETYVAREYSFE